MNKNCSENIIAEQPTAQREMYPVGADEKVEKKTLLLHSCCGPCSTACIERVLPDYKVTIFFYNPNITEADEYEKRKESQIKFINEFNETLSEEDRVGFIEGDYDPELFFNLTKGYEEEPEGGKRCTICFKFRMEEAAREAKNQGFQYFGTTLTVSPHKNYPLISEIGKGIEKESDVEFLDIDFKKKAGFQRSIQLSKEYELYRQNFCGCIYSRWT